MRKTNALIIPLFIQLVLLSCTIFDGNDHDIEYFMIKIDSIAHPDTIQLGDALVFNLYGYVGPDGCYRFSHFEQELEPLSASLTVWGAHGPDGICTDALVFLNGRPYKTIPKERGTFRLRIKQPDRTTLTMRTIVE